MVTATHAGKGYELIYSQSVVLLDKNDALSFVVHHSLKGDVLATLSAHLVFHFEDLGTPLTSTIFPFSDTAVGEGRLWKLHRWYSPTYVEVSQPDELVVKDSLGAQRTLLVKFRTQAVEALSHRTFDLSVWLQN